MNQLSDIRLRVSKNSLEAFLRSKLFHRDMEINLVHGQSTMYHEIDIPNTNVHGALSELVRNNVVADMLIWNGARKDSIEPTYFAYVRIGPCKTYSKIISYQKQHEGFTLLQKWHQLKDRKSQEAKELIESITAIHSGGWIY